MPADGARASIPAMPSLASLWLPILLSAVAVFVMSSLVHMVLQVHKNDYKKLPDEPGLIEALRRAGVGAGQYVFPHCASMEEMKSEAMQARWRSGPCGTLIVRPAGGIGMGKALGQWFLFCIVVTVMVAYLTSLAKGPGAPGVFRVATTVAFLGYAFSSVTDSIWKTIAWSTTWRFVFDGVLYALATGAVFAALWPAA